MSMISLKFLVNFSNGHLVHSPHAPKITLYEVTKDKAKRKKILVQADPLHYISESLIV